MHKLENRAKMCLALAGILFIGIMIFTYRFVVHGKEWASFYGNNQIYTEGEINRGKIIDRNGTVLLDCTKSGIYYPEDEATRRSTVHVVGDTKGNVATGAINLWKGDLIGYDILNGTYDTTAKGKEIKLTIDERANREAVSSLGEREGTVGVFNYKTGEILCLANTPTFDPKGDIPSGDSPVFFNSFMSGLLTPGSTFKLVTSAAAIDNLADINNFSFHCTGVSTINGSKIPCTGTHGTQDFKEALANSCNGAFGLLADRVGGDTLSTYMKDVGLKKSLEINGIKTAKGSGHFPNNDDVKLAWAGIGQGDDLVNPCTMMVFMGAIANKGKAINPTLFEKSNLVKKIKGGKGLGRYLEEDTANELKEMMKNNVVSNYGEENFGDLDIYGKSGTAEVGRERSDSWFVGFIDNPGKPYAFVVWVKNGGTGYQTAGPIARNVLEVLCGE